MGKCIKCGTNFVGTPENPPKDGLCRYCEIDSLRSKNKSLTDKLHASEKENNYLRGLIPKLIGKCIHCGLDDMGKCSSGFPGCAWADDLMVAGDEFIAHLRQENAELKAKNLEMREVLLDCSLHFEEMEDVVWNDDSDINSTTFQRVQESVQKALTHQPTQDPATSIAYGLYPSSARPVNPQPDQDSSTDTPFEQGWKRGMMNALDMIRKGVNLEMAVNGFGEKRVNAKPGNSATF